MVVKHFKLDKILLNVVIVITTCNQVLKQHVLGECELMEKKSIID
jgi:hypothetical protein